jgi:hypothetical protein
MAKVRLNYDKQRNWFDTPEGTQEEMEEAFNVAENYLYNILSYADKEEHIPDDVLQMERRIFSFCKRGPRAAYFRLDPMSKLVSADVLYMLTSTLPAEHIAKKFNMSGRKVRAIRRGESDEWYWEYLLVRRLKAILRANMDERKKRISKLTTCIYTVSELNEKQGYDVIAHISSFRNATKYRKDIIPEKRYNKLLENRTLDIIFPITKVDLL